MATPMIPNNRSVSRYRISRVNSEYVSFLLAGTRYDNVSDNYSRLLEIVNADEICDHSIFGEFMIADIDGHIKCYVSVPTLDETTLCIGTIPSDCELNQLFRDYYNELTHYEASDCIHCFTIKVNQWGGNYTLMKIELRLPSNFERVWRNSNYNEEAITFEDIRETVTSDINTNQTNNVVNDNVCSVCGNTFEPVFMITCETCHQRVCINCQDDHAFEHYNNVVPDTNNEEEIDDNAEEEVANVTDTAVNELEDINEEDIENMLSSLRSSINNVHSELNNEILNNFDNIVNEIQNQERESARISVESIMNKIFCLENGSADVISEEIDFTVIPDNFNHFAVDFDNAKLILHGKIKYSSWNIFKKYLLSELDAYRFVNLIHDVVVLEKDRRLSTGSSEGESSSET